LNHYQRAITDYFSWLEDSFGPLASQVRRSHVTSSEFARDYLANPAHRSRIQEDLPSIASRVTEFWDRQAPLLVPQLQALSGVRALYGGDIGPRAESAIFQRSGLYFDTVVVPDPLHRICSMPSRLRIPEYYFLKYAVDQLLQKDVYLASVWPPIAFLAPQGITSPSDETARPLSYLASMDCVILANQLFEEHFDTYEEVKAFFGSLATAEKVIAALAQPDLLYLDSDAPRDPRSQLEGLISRTRIDWRLVEGNASPDSAQFILFHIFGRLLQANALYSGALDSYSHPIVDAPASFHWLQWKVISNQDLLADELAFSGPKELALTNALLSQHLDWLSAIGIDDLVKLRKNGRLSELRALIGRDLDKLSAVEVADASEVIKQVDYSLSQALARHQAEIRQLDVDFRSDLAITAPSLLLSIVAYIQPTILPLSPDWAKLAPGLVGTASLQQVIRTAITYIRQKRDIGRKPIAVLWAAKQRSSSPSR
jgi:hypothetical protein